MQKFFPYNFTFFLRINFSCPIFFSLLLSLLFSENTLASNKRDSLLHLISKKIYRCNPGIYGALAGTYYPGNTDSSIYYLLTGAKEAHECRLYGEEAGYYRSAGAQSFLRSDYDNAMNYYKRAIEIYETQSRSKELAEAYRGLGLCYFDQGEYTNSIVEYDKGLKVAEEFRDTIVKGRLINSIGSSLEMMGDYSNALVYYRDALKIRMMLKDSSGMATSYMNVGNMLTQKKDSKNALAAHRSSLIIGKNLNDKYITINALICLAGSQTEFKMLNEAEKTWLEALDESEGGEYSIQKTEIYNGLSKVYLLTKRYNEARVYAESAAGLAKKIKARSQLKTAVFSKAEAFYGLQKTSEAYAIIKEYALLQDSLYKNESLFTAQELRAKYEKEKDARMISNLKFQNEIEKLHTEKESTLNLVFTIVLVITFPLLIIMIVLMIKNVKSARLLRKSLHEKEILLKEVHHRVKNNFQLISSLINLQGSMIEDDSAKTALNNSKNRILSMSLVHEFIYKAENLERINMNTYTKKLGEMIVYSSAESNAQISLEFDIQPLEFGIETVIPYGLILNELITNSMKYAFTGKDNGKIKIELKEISSGKYILRYSDNGKGLPPDFDINNLNSLGMELIQLLTSQLRGELTLENPQQGAAFSIVFHLHP